MKKMIAVLVLILALLISCGGDGGGGPSDITGGPADDNGEAAAGEDTGKFDVADDLPDIDFGGYNFRIYLDNENDTEHVCAEEIIGEVVNDAVYKANRTVEDRFNIKISPLFYRSHNNIKTTVMAGDDAFDIVSGHDISMGSLSLENVFLNLYNIPHLNFDKPWWPKNNLESLTLMNGKKYLISNHISFWWLDATRVMFFNKNRFKDLGYETPYQAVFDGTWTFDKFYEMSKDAYINQSGTGERDDGDFFGFVKSDGEFYCYLESWGIQVVVKDETEILKTNERLPEIMPDVLSKVYNLLFASPGGYQTINDYELPNRIFASGNSLFLFKELSNARGMLREIGFDYGILPMPKMDGQAEYIAGCTDRPYAIPITAKNLERTGIITEAMSAEGYKEVLPAYYEIALKLKYTHDDDSVRTLDIITESVVLDFWYIYGGNDSNMIWSLSELLQNRNPSIDFASYYERIESVQQRRIDQVVNALRDME